MTTTKALQGSLRTGDAGDTVIAALGHVEGAAEGLEGGLGDMMGIASPALLEVQGQAGVMGHGARNSGTSSVSNVPILGAIERKSSTSRPRPLQSRAHRTKRLVHRDSTAWP